MSKPKATFGDQFVNDCDRITEATIAMLISDKDEKVKKEWVEGVVSMLNEVKEATDPTLIQYGYTEKAFTNALMKCVIIRVSRDERVTVQQEMLLEPIRKVLEDRVLTEVEKSCSLVLIERAVSGVSTLEAYTNVLRRHFQEIYPQLNSTAREAFLLLFKVKLAKCDRAQVSTKDFKFEAIPLSSLEQFTELAGDIEEAVQIMVGQREIPSL